MKDQNVFDELKRIWKRQPAKSPPPSFSARVMAHLREPAEAECRFAAAAQYIWRFAAGTSAIASALVAASLAQGGLPLLEMLSQPETGIFGFLL